ncbi:MAG: Hsp20/alpha crystallin family protein, partial [Tepidiformaceae bacterium]
MATTLTRWDPFNEVSAMRNVMDRLFDQSLGRFPSLARAGEDLGIGTLGLDVYETNDEYVVKAAVPGVDPKDVEISVDDDVLTIKGEFAQREDVNEEGWLRRELRYGGFHRQLR